MSNPFQDVEVNPFKDDVVKQPKEVSFSVEGLNDDQLEELISAFDALDADPAPREPVAASKVKLVVSPEGGYGKSHLLGRLFESLGERATKVYLPPFQDPDRPWHSILRRTIQELERPDDEEEGGPSQLENLAAAVLARVGADFIAGGGMSGNPKAKEASTLLLKVAKEPTTHGANVRRWFEWLRERLADPKDATKLASQLRQRNIDLDGREKTWLKILASQLFDDPDSEKRSAAIKWLRAEALEPEEAQLLGLDTAGNDARSEAAPREINDLCFRRLEGLCLLSSYYRPFLFCFDQSEFYVRDPALVKALGNCIYQLFEQLRNQLSIITANEMTWVQEIQPGIERSQRQRLSEEIRLEGIGKNGARELVVERLNEFCLPRPEIDRFFADGWLDNLFAVLPQHPVRLVLEEAAKRFKQLANDETPPLPKPTLEELYEREQEGVRTRKALTYDEDSLIWFVKEIGSGLPGVSLTRLRTQRYFSLEWIWKDRSVAFAFEGGAHWKRWGAIIDEAVLLADERKGKGFFSYVPRTPEMNKVPASTWPKLEAAGKRGFQLLELSVDDLCAIHAAYSLYSSALEGNVPYTGEEALAWLQGRFKPFLEEIAKGHPPTPAKGSGGRKTGALVEG